MVLALASVAVWYQPSVTGSHVWRRNGASAASAASGVSWGKRRLRSSGSVISQNIHILPSSANGG